MIIFRIVNKVADLSYHLIIFAAIKKQLKCHDE